MNRVVDYEQRKGNSLFNHFSMMSSLLYICVNCYLYNLSIINACLSNCDVLYPPCNVGTKGPL